MTKQAKRIKKLTGKGAITFDEVAALLSGLGYTLDTNGKTSGSRYEFYRKSDGAKIMLHKPHPGDGLKPYARRQLIEALRMRGDIE